MCVEPALSQQPPEPRQELRSPFYVSLQEIEWQRQARIHVWGLLVPVVHLCARCLGSGLLTQSGSRGRPRGSALLPPWIRAAQITIPPPPPPPPQPPQMVLAFSGPAHREVMVTGFPQSSSQRGSIWSLGSGQAPGVSSSGHDFPGQL